jgi:hypothetical protein
MTLLGTFEQSNLIAKPRSFFCKFVNELVPSWVRDIGEKHVHSYERAYSLARFQPGQKYVRRYVAFTEPVFIFAVVRNSESLGEIVYEDTGHTSAANTEVSALQ